MPPPTLAHVRKQSHHHRRYSWPPSLHLIDISNIPVPLPDINEEPFAHFVSSPPPEEDIAHALDSLVYSAGIDTKPTSTAKERSLRFRTSIALRFARLIGKHLNGRAGGRNTSQKGTQGDGALASGLGHARTLLAESDALRSRGRAGSRARGQRHSWHAPASELYTIVEE